MTTRTKTPKKEAFPIYPISAWSMTKYGVSLFINHMQPPLLLDGVALDVEDDGNGNFVGIGICGKAVMGGLEACYYWSDWELVKGLIIPRFVGHNGLSDIRKLRKWGFKIDDSWLIWDTQLMAHYQDSSRKRYGLKDLAKADLGIEYPGYKDLVKRGKEFINLDILQKEDLTLVAEYNAGDTYCTAKLAEKQGFFKPGVEVPTYYTSFERPAANVFAKMEDRGIRVDLNYLRQLKESLEAQKAPIEKEIKNELGNINLNSPKQLLTALIAKGIQPVLKGKPSTDKRALEMWKKEHVVSNLVAYSEVDTLLASFVNPYLERNEGVVHPHFNQTGTRTGRPSCSNPNLLQIPKRTENGRKVRRMFIAREGCLFGDCDFGQIEPRVLAHLSEDEVLSDMFRRGVDFHTFTSERLGIDRDRAKILNLSVGYRATFKSVSQQLKCSWEQAQKEIDKWWSLFPQLYDWQAKLIYECRKTGYCTTVLGRKIRVDDLTHPNQFRREGAERQLLNNITQGSAAEIMKSAMVKVDNNNIDILIQVYDELLIEEPEEGIQEAIHNTIDIMTHAVILDVPLTVDAGIGNNWSEAKS